MDDYKIALGALLDANAKGDIDKQLNAIKDLSVTISKATLSNDVINDIKRQLTQNGIDLKLVFGNVSQITNQAKQTGQQIGQQIQNGINDAIQKGNLQKDFFFSADKKNDTAKRAQEYFRGISNGVVTVTEQMENLDDKSELRGFIVNIKNAKGEIESLKYSLRNILDDNGNVTGQKFAYVSGSINDANVVKQFEELNKVITDYEIKLANFKTKYSNANVDYTGFDGVFENFKLGIATTNELALAFNQLENSAKRGVQSLKSQSSSFDPIQQTLNNMRDLPSMLTTLEANMSGIKDKTSIAEISVTDLRNTFNELETEMTNSGGKVPLTDEWLTKYRELMSTVTSATKQVDALKKSEASDNSQTQKQANYYSTILSNYREIYSLKQKLLTAGKEETKVIQEQIRSLNSSNASINKQLGKQGLKDSGWQTQIDDLKEELDYSLRISEARQKDKANQSSLNNAQREAIQIVEELEQAYQRVQDIKIKIASLDKAKDGEKISTLSQEDESAQAEYKQLYDRLRKRKNYDKESWNETKSAIDSATQSAIEYNNSRAQDTLNKAQKTEVTNFNILKNKWEEQGVLVGEFKEKVEAMESSLVSVGSKGELDNLKLQIKDLRTEADKIAKVDKIQLSFDNGHGDSEYKNRIQSLVNDFERYGLSVEEANKKTANLRTILDGFKVDGNFLPDDQLVAQADKLEAEFKAVKVSLDSAKLSFDKFLQPVSSEKASSLIVKINDFLSKNHNITKEAKEELLGFIRLLQNGNVNLNDWNKFDTRLKEINIEMREANRLGKSLKQTLVDGAKSFAQWTFSSGAVMEVWQGLKRVYNESLKINDVMTDLAMSTDLTASQMESVVDKYSNLGEKLNATTSEMIASGTEWIKQGQSIADTETLITSAMVLDKVGKLENAQATEYLTSTMKGYKVAVEDTMDIVDKLSAVDMASATNVGGLAEAMSQVANNANLAGVSMDKLLGYIAVIGETTGEGMSSVGTGLNAIFSRMGNIKLARLKDYQNNGEDLNIWGITA